MKQPLLLLVVAIIFFLQNDAQDASAHAQPSIAAYERLFILIDDREGKVIEDIAMLSEISVKKAELKYGDSQLVYCLAVSGLSHSVVWNFGTNKDKADIDYDGVVGFSDWLMVNWAYDIQECSDVKFPFFVETLSQPPINLK